jgi:hypothetical protein
MEEAVVKVWRRFRTYLDAIGARSIAIALDLAVLTQDTGEYA